MHITEGIWDDYFHYEGYEDWDQLVITSICDSQHSATSLHWIGHAVDIRTKNFPREALWQLASDVREALGQDYDVVLESVNKDNEHMHIEYQPKGL